MDCAAKLALVVLLMAGCANPAPTPPSSVEPGGSASRNASASPSALASPAVADDLAVALDVATRFETARAAGSWADAWNLLAPVSQVRIGALARFAEGETAYNALGGSRFEIQPPTRDAEMIQPFVGAMRPQIALEADMSRGYLVFIAHPDVRAASAGSTGLFVAPLHSGEWRIWIVH